MTRANKSPRVGRSNWISKASTNSDQALGSEYSEGEESPSELLLRYAQLYGSSFSSASTEMLPVGSVEGLQDLSL